MTRKTEALVRDLAGLFVKYGAADWAPLLDELEGAKRLPSIRVAVEELAVAGANARKRPAARQKARTRKPKAPAAKHPERSPAIEQLRKAMAGKLILPTTADMRSAQMAIGLKGPSAKKREQMMVALLKHLDAVDDQGFTSAMAALEGQVARLDATDGADYQRWFRIISAK